MNAKITLILSCLILSFGCATSNKYSLSSDCEGARSPSSAAQCAAIFRLKPIQFDLNSGRTMLLKAPLVHLGGSLYLQSKLPHEDSQLQIEIMDFSKSTKDSVVAFEVPLDFKAEAAVLAIDGRIRSLVVSDNGGRLRQFSLPDSILENLRDGLQSPFRQTYYEGMNDLNFQLNVSETDGHFFLRDEKKSKLTKYDRSLEKLGEVDLKISDRYDAGSYLRILPNKLIAEGNSSGQVRLIDADSMKPLTEFVPNAAVSPDGSKMIFGYVGRESWRGLSRKGIYSYDLSSISRSETSSLDKLIDPTAAKLIFSGESSHSHIYFSPDGDHLVFSGMNKSYIFDLRSNKPTMEIEGTMEFAGFQGQHAVVVTGESLISNDRWVNNPMRLQVVSLKTGMTLANKSIYAYSGPLHGGSPLALTRESKRFAFQSDGSNWILSHFVPGSRDQFQPSSSHVYSGTTDGKYLIGPYKVDGEVRYSIDGLVVEKISNEKTELTIIPQQAY